MRGHGYPTKHYVREAFFVAMKKFLIFASFYVFFSICFGCERVDVSILDDHSTLMEVHKPALKIGFMVADDRILL